MPELSKTAPIALPGAWEGSYTEFKKEVQQKVVNYCLYARKSSEDDERQALSIDSQIKEMLAQAENQGLKIAEVRKESHSAKNSSQRPVFNALIEDIRKGLFQGILSWAPDRLSRNAGDLGTLVDLIDRGILTEIRTHGQTFTNSPNDKFLLMILCSQAKLENDNRGVNVVRGMKAKCEMGYRPNMVPIGYLNDKYAEKGQKKIFLDPERAPFIKQSFEKVAHEGYSGRKIYIWLRDEVGFKTRNGKPMTLSMIYRMFNNPYYTGIFEYPVGSGKWYKGAHEPIVSKELFKLAQEKMVVAQKSMPGTKEFAFTKIIKCGHCGSGITAQEKFKSLKNGGRNRYVYYHCTQIKNFQCHEPYINEVQLTREFMRIFSDITETQLKNSKDLLKKFGQFKNFRADILDIELKDNQETHIEINIVVLQKFVEYIFTKGSKKEKQELINCLNAKFYLKDKELYFS